MSVSKNRTDTLRAQMSHHQPLVFENHPTDSRIKQLDDVSETVCSRYGTGGE